MRIQNNNNCQSVQGNIVKERETEKEKMMIMKNPRILRMCEEKRKTRKNRQ